MHFSFSWFVVVGGCEGHLAEDHGNVLTAHNRKQLCLELAKIFVGVGHSDIDSERW